MDCYAQMAYLNLKACTDAHYHSPQVHQQQIQHNEQHVKNNNHKHCSMTVSKAFTWTETGLITIAWPLGAASEELSSDKNAVRLRRMQR